MKKQVLVRDGRGVIEALRDPRIAVLTDEHAASSYGQPVLVIDGVAYGPADRTASGNTLQIADEDHLRVALDPGSDLPKEPTHIREWNRLVALHTCDTSWVDE